MIKKLITMLFIMIGLLFTACGGGGGGSTDIDETERQQPDIIDGSITEEPVARIDDKTYLDGKGFEFKIIQSELTGRKWLDRNMGASRPCEDINLTDINLTDINCYGDYYQWGRKTDGHEDHESMAKEGEATTLDGIADRFIISEKDQLNKDNIRISDNDWSKNLDIEGDKRERIWKDKDGVMICPLGFRVPTNNELFDEVKDLNGSTISTSFLKLPMSGNRGMKGSMFKVNREGYFWSGSANYQSHKSYALEIFTTKKPILKEEYRVTGMPVRCTEENSAPIANIETNLEENIHIEMNLDVNVTLDASSSSDDDIGDEEDLQYIWSVKFSPENSTATIENINAKTTAFTPVLEGGYVISLTVIDNGGLKSKPKNITFIKGWMDEISGPDTKNTSYQRIISPYTGKIWLDRNLGATRKCENIDIENDEGQTITVTNIEDSECYGYYYQWGRSADGHENAEISNTILESMDIIDVNTTGTTDFIISLQKPDEETVTENANTVEDVLYDYDWSHDLDIEGDKRERSWMNGSLICPSGFRVPTDTELALETFENGDDDIDIEDNLRSSFLKIPLSGLRNMKGEKFKVDREGYLWSSKANYQSHKSVALEIFTTKQAVLKEEFRVTGMPVRCVK